MHMWGVLAASCRNVLLSASWVKSGSASPPVCPRWYSRWGVKFVFCSAHPGEVEELLTNSHGSSRQSSWAAISGAPASDGAWNPLEWQSAQSQHCSRHRAALAKAQMFEISHLNLTAWKCALSLKFQPWMQDLHSLWRIIHNSGR